MRFIQMAFAKFATVHGMLNKQVMQFYEGMREDVLILERLSKLKDLHPMFKQAPLIPGND